MDICALLQDNIGMCPSIRSAKRKKQGVVLRRGLFQYNVKIISSEARIGILLIYPVFFLYLLLIGLLEFAVIIAVNLSEPSSGLFSGSGAVGWVFGSIGWMLAAAVEIAVAYAIVHLPNLFARKGTAEITEYVRKIVTPHGISVASNSAAPQGIDAEPHTVAPPILPPPPKEKKSGKPTKTWIIIGIVAAVIAVAGIIAAVCLTGGSSDYDADEGTVYDDWEPTEEQGVSLSETYQNEAEGFSFMYPWDWRVSDADETELDTIVSIWGSSVFGENAHMDISKVIYNEHYFVWSKSDWDLSFQEVSDASYEAEVIELAEIELDGRPARKVTIKVNSDGTQQIQTYYLYATDSGVYLVLFTVLADSYENEKATLDAIMDSYIITAPQHDSTEEILFCGIPVQTVMGISKQEVLLNFGEPDSQDDSSVEYGEFGTSEWASFQFGGDGTVNSFEGSAVLFSYQGQSLEQDEVLDQLPGEPYENLGGTAYIYQFRWCWQDYQYTFSFPWRGNNQAPHISVDRRW